MALYGKTDDLAGMPKYLTKKRYIDGTSATIVDTVYNSITIPGSLGVTGDRVYYTSTGAIAGLTNATAYYIDHLTANTIKLYDTKAHAVAAGVKTALSTVAISGTAGQFSVVGATLAVGDVVTVTGTLTGTGTITGYASGVVYKVSAKTGSSPNVTAFTLTTYAGVALVTTVGTIAGLTFTASVETGLLDLTAVGTDIAEVLQLWPENVFFVDQSEAQLASNKAKGFHGGGWYKYSTYTDVDSVVRHKPIFLAELQVLPAVSGDAEDTVLGDAAITITLQPLDTTVAEPTAATFIATASVTLTNPVSVLTYQWQKAESTANTTFANIVGATSASYTTGATAVAAGAGDTHLDKYRVLVSVSGGVSMPVITSNAVTLTVTV